MKYNSIGEQLIAKAKELDPNYKPDKFNDMSEAIDILLNNSGGNIWLDIAPYLNEDMTSISQEGYDLVYNAFFPAEETENSNNKYAGILFAGYKMFFNELAISDKIGLNFIANLNDHGVKGYIRASIYNDKSVELIDEASSSSNKIWYELDTMSGTITQNQYDEIKALVDTNSLAGITFKTLSTYYPLANIFDGGIFVFRGIGLGLESTGGDRKNAIDESTITIKPDLSITFSLEEIFFPVLTQGLSSQSIPSIKTDGYQQNLTIGNGLKINEATSKLELNYRFVTLQFHNLTYKFNDSENAFNTLCIDITTYSYVLDSVLNAASSILGTEVNRDNISSLFTQFDSSTFLQFISGFILTITELELTAYSNFHIYESNTTQQNIINNYNALLIENLDGYFFPVYTGPETIKNLWIGAIGNELSKNENSTFTFNESWYGD